MIERPRRLLSMLLGISGRVDHVYVVLQDFSRRYCGRFSILDLGNFDGRASNRLDAAVRHLSLDDRVTVHRLLNDAVLDSLRHDPPILVWFDADDYGSTRQPFERLLPYLPNGCVIYLDEYGPQSFGARDPGEARLVYEVNHGMFGTDVELVLDPALSLDSRRVYRFERTGSTLGYEENCGARPRGAAQRT